MQKLKGLNSSGNIYVYRARTLYTRKKAGNRVNEDACRFGKHQSLANSLVLFIIFFCIFLLLYLTLYSTSILAIFQRSIIVHTNDTAFTSSVIIFVSSLFWRQYNLQNGMEKL